MLDLVIAHPRRWAALLGTAGIAAIVLAVLEPLEPAGSGTPMLPDVRSRRSLAVEQVGSSGSHGAVIAQQKYAERFADVSATDRHCLARAIYFESRGEPVAGQIAVAQVVLNRVTSRSWPESICGVVYQGKERGQKCQFSFACTDAGQPLSGPTWQHAQWVADQVLSGGAWLDELLDADHFHRIDLKPVWRLNLQFVRTIGRHAFYAGVM